jgi:hypothetical protein
VGRDNVLKNPQGSGSIPRTKIKINANAPTYPILVKKEEREMKQRNVSDKYLLKLKITA